MIYGISNGIPMDLTVFGHDVKEANVCVLYLQTIILLSKKYSKM
jgi:hypothetical protein